MATIDYQYFDEWRRCHRIPTSRLAEIAGVDQSTLNRWLAAGKAVPGDVAMAWASEFGWRPDLAWRLLFNGDMPVDERLLITPEQYQRLQALEVFIEALK